MLWFLVYRDLKKYRTSRLYGQAGPAMLSVCREETLLATLSLAYSSSWAPLPTVRVSNDVFSPLSAFVHGTGNGTALSRAALLPTTRSTVIFSNDVECARLRIRRYGSDEWSTLSSFSSSPANTYDVLGRNNELLTLDVTAKVAVCWALLPAIWTTEASFSWDEFGCDGLDGASLTRLTALARFNEEEDTYTVPADIQDQNHWDVILTIFSNKWSIK